jgi:hypothetical protein
MWILEWGLPIVDFPFLNPKSAIRNRMFHHGLALRNAVK